MPTTLTNGIQLPDKGSVDWYNSMQSNYNLIDTHLGNTDTHVTAEDKANWNSKQGSLSQAQLDAIAQVATNTSDIATLQSGKANASHTHSSSDITDIDDYATKQYVDNSISGLVDNAPDALNTLNELSAALNDDSNFASTVTTALGAKANNADLATVATSGDYNDLDNLPTIPTKTSDLSNDSNFVVSSNLATVATSGDYDDLSNKPSIPTNTSDLNNDSGFVTLNDFDIPSKTSDLTNDSGFITSSDVPIGTSDLINDSNFVDTSNPAVSSGITSAKVTDYDTHIADTDIHVTTADKNKWNNGVSQAYVFRYSSTALVASSTNSNALLDNTDNLKVGDKVIDSSGVLFSITAIDTANSTFTIGTALIDLAQDSDVVHKSGDETVDGKKTFTKILTASRDITNGEIILQNASYDPKTNGQAGVSTKSFSVNFVTALSDTFGAVSCYGANNRTILRFTCRYFVDSQNVTEDSVEYTVYSDETRSFKPRNNNNCLLGESTRKWKEVYATNYYYGSNNVEFSTKFVTTDTNQTISGVKTFSDNISTKKIISNVAQLQINARSNADSVAVIAGADASEGGGIWIYGKNNSNKSNVTLQVYDTNANTYHAARLFMDGSLRPTISNNGLGSADFKWKSFNGVEPSSLSLPSGNASDVIDISSYITDLSGNMNNYIAPANGWISITMQGCSGVQAYIAGLWGHQVIRPTAGSVRFFMPVLKNLTASIFIFGGTVESAKFFPCQGNV